MAKKRPPAGAGGAATKFYILLAAVGAAGVLALGYSLFSVRADRGSGELMDLSEIRDAASLLELARGAELGEPGAPVQLVIFDDYQCPACAELARTAKPILISRFVDTGKLRIIRFDYPLDANHSVLAARAARCAGDQDRFWDYNDALLARQADWVMRTDVPDRFISYAAALGLDAAEFERCLRSDRHRDAVAASRLLGEHLGVFATPTVIVNGVHGDFRRVVQLVEEQLDR